MSKIKCHGPSGTYKDRGGIGHPVLRSHNPRQHRTTPVAIMVTLFLLYNYVTIRKRGLRLLMKMKRQKPTIGAKKKVTSLNNQASLYFNYTVTKTV